MRARWLHSEIVSHVTETGLDDVIQLHRNGMACNKNTKSVHLLLTKCTKSVHFFSINVHDKQN